MTKKEFKVTCVALADEGRGIVRIEDKTLFVKDLLVGEEAIVETIYKHGKLFECRLVKRLTESKDRVKPLCPYYEQCGGCQIMHLSYEKQLEFKKNKVQNLLHKFAGIDYPVSDTIGVQNPYNFRNKVQKVCGYDKKTKKAITGFYKGQTHDLVNISNCLIENKNSNIVSKEVIRLINDFKYEPYDEDKHRGLIRHVLIKYSDYYKECLVCLVINGNNLVGGNNFVKALTARCKEVKSVVLNFNTRRTNVILGEKEKVIYGTGKIKDRIFDKDFFISSQSFFQTNSHMIETLYKIAIDSLNLTKEDEVLDAYSGTGTIGISMSGYAKHVTLCELNTDAYKDSILNAKINKCDNITFVNKDCTEFLINDDSKYDVIVMDPPRKGSTKEFVTALCNKKPKKVAYISCNPATLARDLTYFSEDYKIEKVVPVDMFPHSEHIETVCALSLKKSS